MPHYDPVGITRPNRASQKNAGAHHTPGVFFGGNVVAKPPCRAKGIHPFVQATYGLRYHHIKIVSTMFLHSEPDYAVVE